MNREEAMVAITTLTKLRPEELEGFLACSAEERQLLVQAYRDAGTIPSPDTWTEVLNVMKTCAELAGYVLPVLNVVQAVYGL
jgi:hypothetical protein